MDNDDRIKILFVMLSMGFLLLAYSYVTLPEAVECELRTTKGAVLSGNCTYLYKMKYEGSSFLDGFKGTVSDAVACPPCMVAEPIVCPDQILCPTCPTLGNCPPCTCEVCTKTACPECSSGLDPATEKELLNLRYPGNGVAAVSFGYHEALMDVWELLEVKDKPKFKITASRKTDIYKYVSGVAANMEEDLPPFCFKNLGGYFILNRSVDENGRKMWGWNDERCKSSALRVNDL